MAGKSLDTTLKFNADVSDFNAALKEAKAATSRASAEFKRTSSTMDNWGRSTEGLEAKIESLEKIYQAQDHALQALRIEYDRVAEEQGENSEAAETLKTKLIAQEALVGRTQTEWKKYKKRLEEVQNEAEDAGKESEEAGKKAKKSGDDASEGGDGWTIFKDVLAGLAKDAITGVIDTLKEAAEATREYRREMAQMAQNASDSGQDMSDMKEVLADVSAITGETDAAMEGLNMLMATGFDTAGIELAADALSGAATKFDGLKFEGIAEGLQETLATGAAVGPFAELIERTGGDLEAFNKGMGKCTTAAERQQYALQWLSDSGLKGVHDSYVQNNADLVAAEKAQYRVNEAMASIGSVLEPVSTALTNLKALLLESIAPVLQDIITWVTENMATVEPIVVGIAAAFGVLAAALAIQGIISGVTKAFALLNTTLLANPIVLIVAVIAGLVAAFINLWNNCESFRNFWINLWEGIKTAFGPVVTWLSNAAQAIATFFVDAWDNIKAAWAGVTGWFSSVRSGISNAFANVDSWLTEKFGGAWKGIKAAFSPFIGYFQQKWNTVKGIFSAVKSVLQGDFQGAWNAIKGVFSGWGSYFSGLWNQIISAFSGALSGMASIGKNIVTGLWNGISNSLSWIKSKITGWVGDVTSFIKNLFGIHSPSRLMRDEVGKMLGLGMAEGIERSRSAVNDAMRGLNDAAMGGLSVSGGGAAAASAGKTINFYQTNNSPRALSRREIYRQTHNALAFAGGV